MQSLLVEESEEMSQSAVRLPIPFTKFRRVRIEGVPQVRVDSTVRSLLAIRRSLTLPAIVSLLLFSLVGLVLLYFGTISAVLTLINPFICIIVILLVYRYVHWLVRSLNHRVLKHQRLLIRKLLEIENRDYYYKKLIKWKVDEDEDHIFIENLRLQ